MSRLRDFASNTAGVREGASPLRQQLKRETAGLHQRLEAQLGLMEPELSIHRYQRVLRTFYGFYAPVEASLVRLAAAGPPLGFPLRARCELIESDLLRPGPGSARARRVASMHRPAAAVVPRGPGGLPVRARGRLPWRTGHRPGAAPTARSGQRQRRIVLRRRRRGDLGEVDPRAHLARWRGARGRAKRGDRRLGVRDVSDASRDGWSSRELRNHQCERGTPWST